MSDAHVRRLIERAGFAPSTPMSLTDQEMLLQELASVRAIGIAYSIEEAELGVAAVAAPIMVSGVDGAFACVGTVSIAAPVSRTSLEMLDRHAAQVSSAVKDVAQRWPIDHLPSQTVSR